MPHEIKSWHFKSPYSQSQVKVWRHNFSTLVNTPKTPIVRLLGSCPVTCTAMAEEEQNTEGAGVVGCIGQESFIGLPSHIKGRM